MRTRTALPTLTTFGLIALTVSHLALAQTTEAPAAASNASAQSQAPVTVPARGTTMESVKSKFGQPTQEIPAVGKPPITRWEYPGYVVFFENDKVLHTVVVK